HFHEPSPHIDWSSYAVRVADRLLPWSAGQKARFAGVSSFGFSGTNAHVVVGEPLRQQVERHCDDAAFLPVSARNLPALRGMAARWAEWLQANQGFPWPDVVYTAALRRTHFGYRAAIHASDPAEVAEALEALSRGRPHPAVAQGEAQREQLAVLFTGQGSQRL